MLKVLTTIALKGVLEELAGDFQRQTGHEFAMTYGPSGTAFDQCRGGAVYDIVIATPDTIDTLISEGFVVAGSREKFATSIVGVAVKAGASHPNIETVANFKQALLDANSVGYTNPATLAASGVHMAKVLDDLGILDVVNAKTTFGQGGSVAEFLITGEIEIALQQICEHRLVEGVEIVGPVPDAIQKITTLSVGLHAQATERETGTTVIEWLTSPDINSVLDRHGLFPID
ncbi:MAG: substrate-binding domain-containing protein [Rhodospirillaceae bacterium]|nr:substrate-binding domain-containing protein [Rhodospirillales bacterium]MBT3904501.1 substrate-binding domain-containing protein [Rhodospirillaceae bacterium]MBT4703585.1 substrate-binding domain-containing protein [Rhodospirillaceae bacterium]MBT5036678.1 substrate-binding domain-containing protein [Rhodospirillaceae bacterium]MBT6220896.1 substrate-binding domain-containing protein [Rhodospirillaceae bacterium]